MPKLKLVLAVVGLVLLGGGVFVASDWTFWDRYFRARTFQSFIDNPFPTVDRLYPQEVVRGVDPSRALPEAAPGGRTISDEAIDEAVRFAAESQSTALLVAHKGVIQVEAYWRGADAETPVYSFSMHKSVIALLTGIAIAEGAIASVDEPLARYLPEWRNDDRAKITIRNALQMNSGLEPMKFVDNPFSKHVKRQIGTDVAGAALDFETVGPPGAAFAYNGANPTLLLLIIERATGRRYADYLSEKLWRPLGNHDAAVWLDHEGGLARGATSLFAVPRDWLRLGELILHGGRAGGRQIVPAAWIEEMTTPSSTNPLYGYLTWIGSKYQKDRSLESFEGFEVTAEAPFLADDIVYFDGLGGQRVYIIPSYDLVIVRTGLLSSEWEDAHLPNILIRGITPDQVR